MLRRQRSDPKPAKTIAGPRIDAYGRSVKPDVFVCEPETNISIGRVHRVAMKPRSATTVVTPRPIKPMLKTVRNLPAGDRARLWNHVASLPCQLCGAHGVQIAHSNALSDGKAKQMKASDFRVAALCPTCHVEIDSGKALSKVERRERWLDAHHKTIGELFARGLVRPI